MNKPNINRNLQKFKQLTAVMGLLLATTLLIGCYENSATNLRENNNIGNFQGYEVEFIRDRHIE